MRKYILAGLLVLVSLGLLGMEINTAARCQTGSDCSIGMGKPTGITLDTDDADLNVGGTTTNTLTLTALTTGTAVFQGADAAGAADTTFDTTGAGAIVVGSADVTGVTLTTDGASLNIEGTAANTLTLTAATTGTMTILGADAAGASNTTLDTSGAGAIIIGSADVTSVTVTTDGLGGSVVLDGSVLAQVPVVSTASGPLTMNTINLATAGATDHDVPDATCAAAADIGTWFTLVVEDASTVVEIQPLDVSNILIVEGLAQSAGEEVDSCTSGTENEGCSITFTCLAADQWYATAQSGTWAVGGAAD